MKRPPARLFRLLTIEVLGSIGSTIMMMGIFFYMQKTFGWGARRNLTLSATQGAVYVVGALATSALSQRLGKRPFLRLLNGAMCIVAIVAFIYPTQTVVVAMLLTYTVLIACQWPLLESLVSCGLPPEQMSRQISVYNLVWAATNTLGIAACGSVIAYSARDVFLLPAVAHGIAAMLLLRREADPEHDASCEHPSPDPALLPLRTLAMRLSRFALPATYALIYALSALMPTLPVIRHFPGQVQTVLASVWMGSRFATFFILGRTTWWHTRPRIILFAAFVLLVSFIAITTAPSALVMIVWQIPLGLALGMIYAGSLYFGMVLSDGSAEHGGYHEALIGLGSVLGPGAGALAEALRPGNQIASITAVSAVLWISAMAAMIVSLQARKSENASPST